MGHPRDGPRRLPVPRGVHTKPECAPRFLRSPGSVAGLSSCPTTSWGLSRCPRSENEAVPFLKWEVAVGQALTGTVVGWLLARRRPTRQSRDSCVDGHPVGRSFPPKGVCRRKGSSIAYRSAAIRKPLFLRGFRPFTPRAKAPQNGRFCRLAGVSDTRPPEPRTASQTADSYEGVLIRGAVRTAARRERGGPAVSSEAPPRFSHRHPDVRFVSTWPAPGCFEHAGSGLRAVRCSRRENA